jgi:hypothetical protein
MDKILVVYHSRRGSTRRVAREIAYPLFADVEEIRPSHGRAGILGYLLPSAIETPRYDPAYYDLVVLGTPVEGASVSSPVRAYLRDVGRRIRRLAVVAVGECDGPARLSRRIYGLSGRVPLLQISMPESARPQSDETAKCERFVEAVRLALAVSYAQAG